MSKIYDALIKLEKKKRPSSKASYSANWTGEPTASLCLRLGNFTVEQKTLGAFAVAMLVLALLVVIVVYQLAARALHNQIERRSLVAATNLSDAAAGHVLGRNRLELHALVSKYVRLDGAAYAFIEDHKGEIVAHTLPDFPPELTESLTPGERRQIHRRIVRLQGKTAYETRAPILEGQAGAARIGVWEESVAAEVNRSLWPIVGAAASLLAGGVILCFFFAQGVLRRLTDTPDRFDTGVLTTVGNQLTD